MKPLLSRSPMAAIMPNPIGKPCFSSYMSSRQHLSWLIILSLKSCLYLASGIFHSPDFSFVLLVVLFLGPFSDF